jgi:nuclear pore complex protein Nup107
MDEDDVDEDEEEVEVEEDADTMDEEMDGVNGAASETGSVFPASEPSLKSVFGMNGKAHTLQGLLYFNLLHAAIMSSYFPDSPQLFTAAGAQEALHPLRRTADRVTRQIEAFADKLDQFKRKNTSDEFQSIQAAYKLVESYRDLAQNAIQDITTQQTLKRAKAGHRSSTGPESKVNEDTQRLQLEADTWRLLLNLISIDDPASRASFQENRQTVFQTLHRYSTDREIWEAFLSADQYGLECVIAMRWLEETAKTGQQDLDYLITDMEAQAERGQGLWAHGWLYTKEAIKGYKRLRAWPQPLEPDDPGISRSLVTDDGSKPLITQLDPDALTRQKRGLQLQDQFYERATWMTCWKMLRQGENWTTIRKWAQGRLEGWRAVALCGSSVDPTTANTRTPVDDGMTRLMNSRGHDPWRSACHALAHSQDTDEFQRAVYALLCGDFEPAIEICSSWDDFLYVYFNRTVISRYQGFCKQFHRKISHSPTVPVAFTPEPPGHADLQKFFHYLRGNERVGGEARNPFRNLQAAILSKGYDSYFSLLAHAVSQASVNNFGQESVVPKLPHSHVDEAYLIAAEDDEALKIATHVYLIAHSIGYARSDTHFFETASVIVAGYIANLEERGLYDVIPLYASLLPAKMCHSVFSRILIEILDPRDRKQQIRYMQKHGIDVNAVLDAQWSWVSAGVSSIEHSKGLTGYSRVVRRPDGSRVLVPPKKDLIGTSLADEDERMIRSLEWLRDMGGQWAKICKLGTWLYRKFFVTGKVSAARELSHRMRLAMISQDIFGIDVFEFPLLDHLLTDESAPASPSKSKRNSANSHRRSISGSNGSSLANHRSAYQQAIRMYHLETLALGFDALEQFALVYDQISK